MKYWLLLVTIILIKAPAMAQVANNPPGQRSILIDAQRSKGLFAKNFNFCVGAGRANEGLRADWQRQLRLLKKECGFRYIRFHGLLSDDMGVYHEDKTGKALYNWQYIDELFDFLHGIGMKPFVELSFMPNDLASGNQTVFWWKGNVTPPKDYKKWNALIRSLVEHWTERYGGKEVSTWYFEVWNEPNLKGIFFTGNMNDYFKLYRETASTIKSVAGNYKVGGPATAGNAWIPDMINFCTQEKVPIDFISTHTYGVKQGFLDLSGDVGTIVSTNKAAIYSDMQHASEQIKSSAMPGLELHYTEWSSSYTPTDPIHDSYHEAAYILDKVKNASAYVNSMSYWTFTDIFEELGPRFTPFHGGFGLMNYQDIEKPAYFAYRFLNQLGPDELVSNDAQSIACMDKQGNTQLLFWHFTITHPGDSVNDQVYYKRDLPSQSAASAQINVKNLRPGRYKMDVYKVGYRANDAYSAYYSLGSPAQLTRQQVELLHSKATGKAVSSSIITINAGTSFKKLFSMRQNDVILVTFQKI